MQFEDTHPSRPLPLRPAPAFSGEVSGDSELRIAEFRTHRRRWPGFLAAAVLGAGLAAAAVSSFYDERTFGARLDAGVAAAQSSVKTTAEDTALAAGKIAASAAEAVNDAAITASVKTALAADPALSAVKIEVTTTDGVVQLDGPAPDHRSRERAEMIAVAPRGVVRVENRLVVAAAPSRM